MAKHMVRLRTSIEADPFLFLLNFCCNTLTSHDFGTSDPPKKGVKSVKSSVAWYANHGAGIFTYKTG